MRALLSATELLYAPIFQRKPSLRVCAVDLHIGPNLLDCSTPSCPLTISDAFYKPILCLQPEPNLDRDSLGAI